MEFDRKQTKREVRASMKAARPRPVLVTLVYALLTGLVPTAVLTLAIWLAGGFSLEELTPALWQGGSLAALALGLLLAVFAALMALGYSRYCLALARGERAGYGTLLEGFGLPLRAISLALSVWLRSFLWIFPAYLLGALFMWLLMSAGMMGLLPLGPDQVTYLGEVLGGGLGIYGLWVYLRYALAPFFLLDRPEEDVGSHIRRSVQAMKGRKWELVRLCLSFLGWVLVSALTFGLGALWVMPYMGTVLARYYDAVTGQWAAKTAPTPPSGYIPFGD